MYVQYIVYIKYMYSVYICIYIKSTYIQANISTSDQRCFKMVDQR